MTRRHIRGRHNLCETVNDANKTSRYLLYADVPCRLLLPLRRMFSTRTASFLPPLPATCSAADSAANKILLH